jgi:hypothetical protein
MTKRRTQHWLDGQDDMSLEEKHELLLLIHRSKSIDNFAKRDLEKDIKYISDLLVEEALLGNLDDKG